MSLPFTAFSIRLKKILHDGFAKYDFANLSDQILTCFYELFEMFKVFSVRICEIICICKVSVSMLIKL